MKSFDEVTFEKTCVGYMLVSMALALPIPTGFSIESHLSFPVDRIPFASYVLRIPGRLNSVSLYFSAMWMLLPVVVAILVIKPQKSNAAEGVNRALMRLTFAAFVAFAIFVLVCSAFYLDASSLEPTSRGVALLLLMARYRIALGAMGGTFMITSALSVYMAFVLMPRLWCSYFTSSINR